MPETLQMQYFTQAPPAPVWEWSGVRFVNEPMGEIVGHIAMWGTPEHRDSYGTFFDKANPPDMGLDFLPIPLMYEHGMSGDVQRDIIGRVVQFWFDEKGIAFRAFLNKASVWFEKIVKDIIAKKLKTSSATAGHIADFDSLGRFIRWYLSELSLTETPAESTMSIVKLVRSANCPDGQCYINPFIYPRESEILAGVSASGFTQQDMRSQVMSALLQLLQSGGDVTPEALVAAAQQDGIDPQDLLNVLQQMAQGGAGDGGGEMMSAALAGAPVPGATPAPSITVTPAQPQTPGANPNPTVPGGVPGAEIDPELIAAFQAFLGSRSAPGGRPLPIPQPGVALTPAQRQMIAPPVPGNYRMNSQNPAPQRSPVPRDVQVRAQRQRALDIQMADRYQHVEPDAMALGYMLAEKTRGGIARMGQGAAPVSETYLRAMAYKTAREIARQNSAASDYAVRSKFPFKNPDEVFQSDNTNLLAIRSGDYLEGAYRSGEVMDGTTGQGAEWIYDLQGTSLWEVIRNETPVYAAMRSKGMDEAEIPQGYDSELIPLEGSDPTWYVANGATDIDSSGTPVGTFSTSKLGTGQQSVTVAKLSVAMNFQRELEEGSIINMVQEAQRKIRVTSSEQIDYILLNGDTAAGANTNINLIDSTPATAPAKPSYMLLNGIIKLALAQAASRRDAGASFDETDFLATFKKLPASHRQNRAKLLYILDSDTGIAASNIATLKTRDVFSRATLEEGVLTSIWRIDVLETAFMYLANTAGKISATAGNNLYGRLLCVVPNQWAARWKRRIQTDVTYFPFADTTQVVAHMRWGLAYRDAYAAAISYDIPVDLP